MRHLALIWDDRFSKAWMTNFFPTLVNNDFTSKLIIRWYFYIFYLGNKLITVSYMRLWLVNTFWKNIILPAEWKTMQTRAIAESGVSSSVSEKRCKVERSPRMVHSPKKGTILGGHIFLYTLSWYAPRTGTAYEYSFTI